MKFTCLQEHLNKGLNIVSKAVPTKAALPILSNILISTENGRVKLSSNNMETEISTYIGASVDEDGSITVPARLLKEFIANLSPSTVAMSLTDDILHISSQKTKSKFNGVAASEFPQLHFFSKQASYLEIEPKDFNHATTVVGFAASSDDTRPVLTGVLIKWNGEKLTMAAADGFRLSEVSVKAKGECPEFTVLIPAKTFMEISRIFGTGTEAIKFSLNNSENLAFFECEDTFVATRVLSGEYPDYRRIIPEKGVMEVTFASSDFAEAVKLTNVFAKDASGSAIKIIFDPKGIITIMSSAQQTGEHESKIAAEVVVDGKAAPLTVVINSKYLLEMLSNIKSDKLTVLLNETTTSPCLFKALEHESLLHVIARMQVQ